MLTLLVLLTFIFSFSDSKSAIPMTKLLVANGVNSQYTVEVVNLDESLPDLVCENLPDHPFGGYGSVGVLYNGSKPVICGGFALNQCHVLENNQWHFLANMTEERFYATLTKMVLQDGMEESIIAVAGFHMGAASNTIEAFDGFTWEQNSYPGLEFPFWLHCSVEVEPHLLMIVGGLKDPQPPVSISKTYFLNTQDKSLTTGPELITSRFGHSCGLLEWFSPSSGKMEKVIVVAGGGAEMGLPSSSVELLFLEQGLQSAWVSGPDLPTSVAYGEMVNYQNSLLLVGGVGYPEDGQQIYRLSSPEGPWTTMDLRLKEKRFNHVAFLIPNDLAVCH